MNPSSSLPLLKGPLNPRLYDGAPKLLFEASFSLKVRPKKFNTSTIFLVGTDRNLKYNTEYSCRGKKKYIVDIKLASSFKEL